MSGFSQAYREVCSAMVSAYRQWGGIEAEQTGMVNVSGEMTKAVIAVFQENGWLNDAGIAATTPSNTTQVRRDE